MAFDFTVWATDLLAAAIAGLVGGTVGSYFRGYSNRKGENRASYEDFPSLVKQEFAKAFEQEAGKRLATHQDIENVLREVQAVTEKTETIKAQIGADVWLRQTVWHQRREAYANILRRSHAVQNILINLVSRHGLLEQIREKQLEERNLPADVVALTAEYAERHREFMDALTEAELFVEAIPAIRGEYIKLIREIEERQLSDKDKAAQKVIVFGVCNRKLVDAARRDLAIGIQA